MRLPRFARLTRRLAVAAWCLAAGTTSLRGQDLDTAPAPRRFTAGAELSAIAGPRDDDAFFNYTDYQRNALRVVRVRLQGEWRLHERLAIVGEVRTENATDAEMSGLFLRWRPWTHRALYLQAGRIPPVIGAFGRRAYGRDNAVVGLPLAYQYLTSLRADALPASIDDVLRMRGRGWQSSFPIGSPVPAPGVSLLSASRWDTGVEVGARWRWLEVAGAVTRGAPAVPVVRETNSGRQWSGRLAADAPWGLTVGLSAGRGSWIDDAALAASGSLGRGGRHQGVVAADAEFGWGRWLLRGEWMRSSFEVPLAANGALALGASSAFLEARYRPHPRWQVGARVDRLHFSRVAGSAEFGAVGWDAPVERVEMVMGFRATRSMDLKAGWQGNWRDGGRVRARGYPMAQVLYWF
jgi:hypothetical protein